MLIEVLKTKNIPEIQKAITKCRDVNIKNTAGSSPLEIVAGFSNDECAKLEGFKDAPASAGKTKSIENSKDLIKKTDELIRQLFAKGAEVNSQNNLGDTPLMKAVEANNKDLVTLLISKSADVNLANTAGTSPLEIAENTGTKEMINLLEVNGAVKKEKKKPQTEVAKATPKPAAVPEPAANEPAKPVKTSDTLLRGNGDPLKGLNVAKPKGISEGLGLYYALIIGVDKYTGQWRPLINAVHDAQDFETTLKTKYKMDRFFTLYNEKATRSAIMKTFENLVNTIKTDDNVVIYFSGHGDYKQNMNKGYWVPADATTNSVSDLISNNDIQTFLASIKSKHTLLISDACFSGDIFRGNTLSVPFEESEKYYGEVYKLPSRQALTSGGVESVMDGGQEGHSVFAYYLLKYLDANANKYFDAGSLFNNLKIPVVNNSEQTPHLESIKNTNDEGGQFIFMKK